MSVKRYILLICLAFSNLGHTQNITRQVQSEIARRFGRISWEKKDTQVLSQAGSESARFFNKNYTYGLIETFEIESFGLPGNIVLVTRGMLEVASGEERELSAITAFEQASSNLGADFSDISKQTILNLLLRKIVPEKISIERDSAMRFAQMLINSGRPSADQVLADQQAVRALIRQGQPNGLLRALMKLETLGSLNEPPQFVGQALSARFSPALIDHYLTTRNPASIRLENCIKEIFIQKYQTDFSTRQAETLLPSQQKPPSQAPEKQPNNRLPSGFFSPVGKEMIIICDFLEPGKPFGQYTKGKYHLGEDIAANLDDPIFALDAGKIVHCSENGWGKDNCAILVEHQTLSGVKYLAIYGHLQLQSAKQSGTVRRGEQIGIIGPWDPPHLHLGIYLGDKIPAKMGLDDLPADYKAGNALPQRDFVAPSSFLYANQPQGKAISENNIEHSAPQEPSSPQVTQLNLRNEELHLGDDEPSAVVFWHKRFALKSSQLAQSAQLFFELRALPRKDPIFYINHREICRIIPETDSWQTYQFSVPVNVTQADNIFYVKSFIPNVRHGFDDSLIRNIRIELR